MKINRFFKAGATFLLVAAFLCAPLNRANAQPPRPSRPDFPSIPRPNLPSVPKPTIPSTPSPSVPRPEIPNLNDRPVQRPDGAPPRPSRESVPATTESGAGRAFVSIPTDEWVKDGFPLLFSRDYPVVNAIWEEFERREGKASALQPDSDAVDFQLRNQGERYKGKLLRVQGRLLRAVETPTVGGGSCFDLWILLPDSDKNPIRVLSRRAPSGFKTDAKLENDRPYDPDVKYRDEKVDLVGLYYRSTAFNAGDDFYAAPTLVALDFSVGSKGFFGSKSSSGSKSSDVANRSDNRQNRESTPEDAERRQIRNRYIRKGIRTVVFAALMIGWYIHSSRRGRQAYYNRGRSGGSRILLVALCLTPGLARAQEGVDFWAKATGSTVDEAAREMTDARPSLLDPALEATVRRAFLVDMLRRMSGALGVDVLRERSNDEYVRTHSLGEFVAAPPDDRPAFAPDADAQFYLGRVLDVAPVPLDESARERAGCKAVYRVVVELENSDARAILYAPNLPAFKAPDAFFPPDASGRDERRVAALAVRFGSEQEGDASLPAGIAPRLGWYPTAAPLAKRGVDLSAFEEEPIFPPDALAKAGDAEQKRAIARSLRWTGDDRLPFYETLAASRTPGDLGGQKVDDVVELFNRPEKWQGAQVRLRGWTRRVNQILVDDPIVKAELGLDRYYQIYFFTNDSQGRALVLCAPDLPDGLNVGGGQEFRKEIELSGVFYKTWAFKKPASDDAPDAATTNEAANNPSKDWTSAPVVIGRVTRVEQDSPAPAPPIAPSTILTLFAFLAVAWIVLRRIVARRDRNRSILPELRGRP